MTIENKKKYLLGTVIAKVKHSKSFGENRL